MYKYTNTAYAAKSYPLIDDLLKEVTAAGSTVAVTAQSAGKAFQAMAPEGSTPDTAELQKANEALQQKILELKKALETPPPVATRWDYILFGIIGAAIVPAALLAANSKILDFKSDIDYLLFASFCIAGALFSKSWIKTVVNKLKT